MTWTRLWPYIFFVFLLACGNNHIQQPEANVPTPGHDTEPCSFGSAPLPGPFIVLAGGAYSGRPSGRQIDESGHEATVLHVVVNVPEKPVALMLGSYEPTIWKIAWTPQTRINAIVLSGYHTQILTGIYDDVKVLHSTYANNGPCPFFFVADDGMEEMEPLSRKLFQRPIQQTFVADNGSLLMGQPVKTDELLISNDTVAIEAYFTPNTLPSGRAGLRQALDQGLLRQATRGDAREWELAYQKHVAAETGVTPSLPEPIGADADELDNVYVVLKPFTLPAGLFGDAAAAFFVPRGVPRPTGVSGHAVINDYNQLRQ